MARDLRVVPPIAALLGAGGLIPFFGLAAALIMALPLPFGLAPLPLLIGYGIAILSFMGGVHWGLAMRDGRPVQYVASVIASLYAWPAIILNPADALAWLAVGFAALLAFDLWAGRRGWTSDWYNQLRWRLSLGAILSLTAAAGHAL